MARSKLRKLHYKHTDLLQLQNADMHLLLMTGLSLLVKYIENSHPATPELCLRLFETHCRHHKSGV